VTSLADMTARQIESTQHTRTGGAPGANDRAHRLRISGNPVANACAFRHTSGRRFPGGWRTRATSTARFTVKPKTMEAGVNRVAWNLRADRIVPPTPQEEEQAARAAAQGGGENAASALNGPLLDPGDYTVEITISGSKAAKKFVVEEDPRVTWFSAADRSKRRASLNELVGMTKQAAHQRWGRITAFAGWDGEGDTNG